MNSKPNLAILAEYDLTEYLYDALKACEHPTFWKQGELRHAIHCLYKLCDRGLLSGPPKGAAYSKPFHLTDQGRDVLARIERGLHKPEWLSEHQARCLKLLNSGVWRNVDLRVMDVRQITIGSLAKAGYIMADNTDILLARWYITDLGREAFTERQLL